MRIASGCVSYPSSKKNCGVAARCLLRVNAKQYLQWITHDTFDKRTVQSQMLLGYLQFNDLGERLEPGSGQSVEIVGKSLVPTQGAN
jgi:hypothetical protein